MLDGNIFDMLRTNSQDLELLISKKEEVDLYITRIQLNELCNIPDDKRSIRYENFEIAFKLQVQLISLSFFSFSYFSYSECTYRFPKILQYVLKQSERNREDAYIAESSAAYKFPLVTEDRELLSKALSEKYVALNYREFINEITGNP